jgi:hypothetical protein
MSRQTFDDDALARALRALADAEARIDTPPHVEAAVLARWDHAQDDAQDQAPVAAHAARSRSHARGFARGAATLAAGVTIVGAVALQREFTGAPIALPQRPILSLPALDATPWTPRDLEARTSIAPRTTPTVPNADEPRSALVLVGAPIENGELVHVVRMRVAREALVALGVAETVSTDTVDVDVLVGEDGVARGLRAPL